jgi:hypothetical protein
MITEAIHKELITGIDIKRQYAVTFGHGFTGWQQNAFSSRKISWHGKFFRPVKKCVQNDLLEIEISRYGDWNWAVIHIDLILPQLSRDNEPFAAFFGFGRF